MADKEDIVDPLASWLKDKPTPFYLLVGSFVLLAFSIKYNRYFEETLLVFIYSLLTTILIQIRKHETFKNIFRNKAGVTLWMVAYFGFLLMLIWLLSDHWWLKG